MTPLLLALLACGEGPPATPAPSVSSVPSGGSQPSAPAHGDGAVRGPRPAGGAPPGVGTPFHATPTFELEGGASAAPRSIVLISLDTASAQHMGPYGGPAEMANLDAVAAAGARFDQAISHFPETCLSHWSMWTGVPPEAHGNAPGARGSETTVPTVAEIAGRHGYASAAFIGGVTLTDQACGFGRGFDEMDDRFPLDPLDMRRPARDVSARAARWIRAQEGPFVAFVHYFDAHFPYTPAPPWDTRYDPHYEGDLDGSDAVLRPYRDGQETPTERDVAHIAALYQGELSELDAQLSPVLEAAGPDAIVLVTSDHGESFSHGYWFNHRAGLWDEVTRVPLLLRGPGVPAGAVVSGQVGLIDVAPTLLALAGLPRDRRMAGRDLRPMLAGGGGARAVVHSTTDPAFPDPQLAVRTETRKTILRTGGTLVYDLVQDPGETRDLGPAGVDEAGLRAAHAEALAPFVASRVPAPAPPPMDPAEAARLEALGYLVPGGPPGPPPGSSGPAHPPPRPSAGGPTPR